MKKLLIITAFLVICCYAVPDASATVRNVKTGYGATGDGVADDTAEINAAIAALVSGDSLYFPCGTYLVSAAFTVGSDSNVTINGELNAGSKCVTIQGTGTIQYLMRWGSGGLSTAVALNATALEQATTFTGTFSGFGGLSAGEFVRLNQGGKDFSTDTGGGDEMACDVSGCRGEVLKIASVDGSTATVTTFLHDTYSPSVNGAVAAKLTSVLNNVTIRDLIFDGDGTVEIAIYLDNIVESLVENVTTHDFEGEGLIADTTYALTLRDIAVTDSGTYTSGLGSILTIHTSGALVIDGMTLDSYASSNAFGFAIRQSAGCTIDDLTVDKTGSGTGRIIKTNSTRWCTWNNTVYGGTTAGGYAGLVLEYYSSHNTFNSCSDGAVSGNSVLGMGNYNQYNTFNNCTLDGGSVYQIWQGTSALSGKNDHYLTVNGGTYTGSDGGNYAIGITANWARVHGATIAGPGGRGVDVVGNNACIFGNTFTGTFSTDDIVTSGSNNAGYANTTPNGTSGIAIRNCNSMRMLGGL